MIRSARPNDAEAVATVLIESRRAFLPFAPSAWIDQLYVVPGWTGKGIGTKLLRHAHGVLPRPIRLYTFQENAGARRFYERNGYKAVKFTDGRGNEEKCPDVLYEHAERTR